MYDAYIQAFHRCYPHKSVSIAPKRQRNGEVMHRVIIDGEGGDILLTADDLKFATRMFNRGK